jgi:hypothetical protein
MNLIEYDFEYDKHISTSGNNLQFRGSFIIPIIKKYFYCINDDSKFESSFDFFSNDEVIRLFKHQSSLIEKELLNYSNVHLKKYCIDEKISIKIEDLFNLVIDDFFRMLVKYDIEFSEIIYKFAPENIKEYILTSEDSRSPSGIFQGFFLRNWLLSKSCFEGWQLDRDLFNKKGVLNGYYLNLNGTSLTIDTRYIESSKQDPFGGKAPISIFIELFNHWFRKVSSYPRLTSISKCPFGKYKGHIMVEILKRDTSYIAWLILNLKHFIINKPSQNDLMEDVLNRCNIDTHDAYSIEVFIGSISFDLDPMFNHRENIYLNNDYCSKVNSYDMIQAQELLNIRTQILDQMLSALESIHSYRRNRGYFYDENSNYRDDDCNWDLYNDQLDMDQQDPDFY